MSKHPRLKKEAAMSRHKPFGKTTDYMKYVESANNEKIGKLIKALRVLSQTNVYLIWGFRVMTIYLFKKRPTV
jgi:hypothetical protein